MIDDANRTPVKELIPSEELLKQRTEEELERRERLLAAREISLQQAAQARTALRSHQTPPKTTRRRVQPAR